MENNEEIEVVDKRVKVKFSKLEVLCLYDGMFNVEFVKNLTHEDDAERKLDGHFLRAKQLIKIDTEIDEQTQRLTLLHEVLHGLDFSAGTNLTEEQVELYSEAIYGFIRSNKEFARLLLVDDEKFDILKLPRNVEIGWRRYDFKVCDEIKMGSWETYTRVTETNKSKMLVTKFDLYKEIEKNTVLDSLMVCFNEIQKITLNKTDREKLRDVIIIFIKDNKELCEFMIDDDMKVRLQDFILNEYRCHSAQEYAYIMTKTGISFVEIKRDEIGQLYYHIDEDFDISQDMKMIEALQEYRQSRIDHDVATSEDIQVPLHKYMSNLTKVKYETKWFIEGEIQELKEKTGLNKEDYFTSMPDLVEEDLKTHFEKGYDKEL